MAAPPAASLTGVSFTLCLRNLSPVNGGSVIAPSEVLEYLFIICLLSKGWLPTGRRMGECL